VLAHVLAKFLMLVFLPMKDFFAVGIGASGGGIGALSDFFDQVSSHDDIAYIVITHIKRDHFSRLDEILARHTHLPVIRVTEDTRVLPGHVYLLVENLFLTIEDGTLIIAKREEHDIINRAVDIFFKTLAADFGNKAVGIILSGGGQDGLEGIKAIEKAGGYVMVQTPDSSQFSGMPLSAIELDQPNFVDTPKNLAQQLITWIGAAGKI
jgi:two-component system chemotaxis response regulator CheB